MKTKLPKGWIYISELEELTGISSKTVSSAIKQGKIPKKYIDRVGNNATSPYCINPVQFAKHWFANINPAHPITKAVYDKLEKYLQKVAPEKTKPVKKEKAHPQKENITYAEASLREKIAKAKLAELELQEKEKTLVPKAVIDEQLFNAGKELREAILSVPNRVIDQIIAECDNRTLALNVLYDALADELKRLAELLQK